MTTSQKEQFDQFKENLLDWNKKMNLTAITDDKEIWYKHFEDSLTLLPWLPKTQINPIKLIDIGSGAGFPGIPLKIMRPDISMTLLDSLRKRIFFLEDTVNRLGLNDVECIHARAEDLAKKENYRASYDICTARAVAGLDKLCTWCLPFVKPGGLFLAMKGPNVHEEVKASLPTIEKLGGKVQEIQFIEIMPTLVHSVVVICYT
ncbi:MAG: 16S rRNA (guanine(527)-N(7))-methyltransferase RsmG [Defluviitaleaceae bacterium]|nr:16S rRNA (guanine(527)-N(7))-methyltransferase RsmG [Defluviitaleaceae bacterium]